MAVRQGKLRDGVRQVDAAGRRWYTKAFKAQVVAACRQPGASVARVSLEHGLNANLVRKWLRRAAGAVAAGRPGESMVTVRATHLARLPERCQEARAGAVQRCGSSSSIRLAGCVGSRSSTSFR